jgi:hypothetical protein
MKYISTLALLIFMTQATAGDYMLLVADENNKSDCANQKQWTVKTSAELASSFEQYFYGEQPSIGILKTAFANGHFHFCGSKEIETVLTTLYKIKEKGPKANKNHLNDFIGKIEAIK